MRSTTEAPDTASAEPPPGRLRLTSEGVVWTAVALVVGALAWWKSLNIVVLLTYLMLVLLVLNGLLARVHVRRVLALRITIPPVFAGEATRVGVWVRNTGTRPATVGVTDPTAEPPSEWFLDRMPPGKEVECSARRSFPSRGRFGTSPLVVWSGFPFGLLRYEQPSRADVASQIVVLPAAGVAEPEALRRGVLRQAGGEGRARKVLRQVTTDQADVRGVRPYRPGDSIRWVHWRTSARRGQLLVREYDSAPSPDLMIVVEPWLPTNPTQTQRANLEAALNLAVTVACTWARSFGTRVSVAVAAPAMPVQFAPAGEEFVREALVPLADLSGTAAPVVPGPTAFDRSLARAVRVLVSSRPASPLAAALIRSTGRPFVVLDPTSPLPWYQAPNPSGDASGRHPPSVAG
ncbi:MAG TPA: DUF58 domain-containing protein [Gemmataceae bacterium]|nr:DUF58 domain-containing protein [Gemmataceae bacterium]